MMRSSCDTAKVMADFAKLDRRRSMCFSHEVCTYDHKLLCLDPVFTARFDETLQRMAQDFIVIYDHDGIIIAKRRAKHETILTSQRTTGGEP